MAANRLSAECARQVIWRGEDVESHITFYYVRRRRRGLSKSLCRFLLIKFRSAAQITNQELWQTERRWDLRSSKAVGASVTYQSA